MPNTENLIEKGKKSPSKYITITLHKIVDDMRTEMFTASGWPSVSGDALRALAGKITADQIYMMEDDCGDKSDISLVEGSLVEENKETPATTTDDEDLSAYGTAYHAFGGGKEGKEACRAIAALCEICSIDSLISNFILPLQVS